MAQAMLRSAAFMAFGAGHFTQPALEKAQRSAWWASTEAALRARDGKPLAGKIVAVTGANAGIGFAIASGVARLGATTLLLCRSAERGQAAAEAIRAEAEAEEGKNKWGKGGDGEGAASSAAAPPSSSSSLKLEVEEVDVSSLASIARFAARFEASGRSLYCLINNAGILTAGPKQTAAFATVDGAPLSEASFATNVLGATALTLALKPALLRAAAEAANKSDNNNNTSTNDSSGGSADAPRVVFVSSGGMYAAPLLAEPPLDPPYAGDAGASSAAKPFNGTKVYSRDKRRQVCLAEALARRWSPLGILVASYHPGWADTPGVQTSIPDFREAFLARLRAPAGGADTAVWMACAPADLSQPPPGPAAATASAALRPGDFYLDRRPQVKHVLGFGGAVAGTSYSGAQADALLQNVVALLREQGYGGGGP